MSGGFWSDTAGDDRTAKQNLIEFYALVNLKPHSNKFVWLPDGEKNLICLFALTQLTNVTDRQARAHTQTDTQTPHDDVGGAYASHRVAKSEMNDPLYI